MGWGNESLFKRSWSHDQDGRHAHTGADPEILKGGCTKFSGPELPYSGFDPFFNLL